MIYVLGQHKGETPKVVKPLTHSTNAWKGRQLSKVGMPGEGIDRRSRGRNWWKTVRRSYPVA